MKKSLILMLLSHSALAHHTAEHTMLQQEPAQVIADTRQGEAGDWMYLLWALITLALAAGLIRWLRKK